MSRSESPVGIDAQLVSAIYNERIDHRFKGFAPATYGCTLAVFIDDRRSLFDGSFNPPVMSLHRSALDHNIATMARYCADHQVLLAPHGKTTLAPQLFQRQFDAGAWAITVATPTQVAICRAFGVRRVLLANELVDASAIEWIGEELERDPAFEFFCYVDSLDGVRILGNAASPHSWRRPLRVLVEVGTPGGRTGCRTIVEALEVARAAAGTRGLDIAGVAGYEGMIGMGRTVEALEGVREFLIMLRGTAEVFLAEGIGPQADDEMIVSAGGSVYFDEVVNVLAAPWHTERKVQVVLRPGCYVTHDSGTYEQNSPFTTSASTARYQLKPALEVWCQILARPETGLALGLLGRRDVSFDGGLPRPRRLRGAGGEFIDAAGLTVFDLNDQHAYIDVPAEPSVGVGDWLSCGISHPCTAMDKWHLIPVVDDSYAVVDLVRTFF